MARSPSTFDDKLLAAIRRYHMVAEGETVLVGISGGQDSLSLLHALLRCQKDLGITLRAAHLHHGIRGTEADADQAYVSQVCAEWGVPLRCERVNASQLAREQRVSVEEAGRSARYQFLNRVADEHGCAKIALGHTATDRAETVLMNILRGTGLDGLVGIRPVRGRVIRPLILLTREETAAYCREHGLQPRLDRTNLDTAYLRNRVRLKLMPLLAAEYAPDVTGALLRLAELAEEELAWTEPEVETALAKVLQQEGGRASLRLDALGAMPPGLLRRVLRKAVERVAGSLDGFSMTHILDLERLVRQGQTGAQVALPRGIWGERRREWLLLRMAPGLSASEGQRWRVELPVPGVAVLPVGGEMVADYVRRPEDLKASSRWEVFLDPEAARGGLVVRSWQPGDRMVPWGMTGRKKLQDIFTDAGVPRMERHRVPVVLDIRGEVLWVAGVRRAAAAAVAPDARDCVRVRWYPSPEHL